ncbi:MAG: DUF2335 domain-containing protein [Alphaproteobacteria bacterium]|nr:DUF2335 domain-containing protein [Alphaproteobacteria bacterium]
MTSTFRHIMNGFASLGNFFGDSRPLLPDAPRNIGEAWQRDWQKIGGDLMGVAERQEGGVDPTKIQFNRRSRDFLFPPVEILAKYNIVKPELGTEIIKQWKLESAHRRKLEELTSLEESASRKMGQYYAFSIILLTFILTAILLTVIK